MGVKGANRPMGRKGDLRYSSKVRSFGGGGFIPIRRGFIPVPKFNVQLVGQWEAAAAMLVNLAERYTAAVDRAVREEAQYFRRLIVAGLINQAPGGTALANMPLSPVTLAIRRKRGITGDDGLIATGEMLRAIKVTRLYEGAYFTGISIKEFGSDGRNLALVAEAHEFGEPNAKPRIPARPFIGPVWDKYGSDPAEVRKRFEKRIEKILMRDLRFNVHGAGIFGVGVATKSRNKQKTNRSTNVGMASAPKIPKVRLPQPRNSKGQFIKRP